MSREAENLRRFLRNAEVEVAAANVRAQGDDVEVAYVSTDLNDEGFLVTCEGCKRQGRVPFDPGKLLGLCPDCIGALGLG